MKQELKLINEFLEVQIFNIYNINNIIKKDL